MPDVYEALLDAELSKAFDVWSGYLEARTGEDPEARAELRSLLDNARALAAEGDRAAARAWLADMDDTARKAGLPWAPTPPRPCEADRQARDYVKDATPSLPLYLWDRLDHVRVSLAVTGYRLRDAVGLDAATREDIRYVTARAWMALDLAHVTAAQRELERLEAIARRCGVGR
ncbi:hypothetical protein ABZ642_25090 [Streptomyces sp. NPDC007157]|uniref:hypothetical protein n=1 Tax=Streptomyces sp. NPDC007157 TaxID=3154681 RepID=UPI0033F346AC